MKFIDKEKGKLKKTDEYNINHKEGGGRDSSVDIATHYGLGGPEIESRWWPRFSAPVQTGPGAYPTSCTMCTGSFTGIKRPGRGTEHPPPSSAPRF